MPGNCESQSQIMKPNEYEQGVSDTCEATVLASSRITPAKTDEVRQLVLHLDEPSFYFPEGQNIGVLVPGPHPFGNKSHHRYYTIAAARKSEQGEGVDLELLVRRCFYIDEVSGEEYPGIASNYLCNAQAGDRITLTGPYRSPFRIPTDKTSNLLMIGTGTGIAPFRAFLRRIYEEEGDWQGQVRLFYGARTGMDLLYMNDVNNDLANYYDQKTFQAIQALRPTLLADEADALRQGLDQNAAQIWSLVQAPNTHVYLAGMKKVATAFDAAMAQAAGSADNWQAVKQDMVEARRWSELTYQ
jgi:ferredoxin--NADP+ reductase